MIAKLLCILLLLAAVPSRAGEQAFDWSYANFFDPYNGVPSNDRLTGRFVVDDVDGNGSFDLMELVSFTHRGRDYTQCTSVPAAGCEMKGFSYQPGGPLVFELRHWIDSDRWVETYHVDAPTDWGRLSFSPGAGEPGNSYLQWDETTVLTVAPVPEPQAYWMLGAGLLVLFQFARRLRTARHRG